jgi:hypothetical protein
VSKKIAFMEMVESLTGYEEEAIEDQFGEDINTLLGLNATRSGRALVFIDAKRQGQDVAAAKAAAMSLTIKEVGDFFEDDADEVMPEEPVTEQGKEGAPDA